jgi:hypothetical protein
MAYYIASTRIASLQPDEAPGHRRVIHEAVLIPAGLFHAVDVDGDRTTTVCGFDLAHTALHAFPAVEFTGHGPHRWCEQCRIKAVAYPAVEDAGGA